MSNLKLKIKSTNINRSPISSAATDFTFPGPVSSFMTVPYLSAKTNIIVDCIKSFLV